MTGSHARKAAAEKVRKFALGASDLTPKQALTMYDWIISTHFAGKVTVKFENGLACARAQDQRAAERTRILQENTEQNIDEPGLAEVLFVKECRAESVAEMIDDDIKQLNATGWFDPYGHLLLGETNEDEDEDEMKGGVGGSGTHGENCGGGCCGVLPFTLPRK